MCQKSVDTFGLDDGASRRSAVQHALILTIRDILAGDGPDSSVKCYAQDPMYTEADRLVLQSEKEVPCDLISMADISVDERKIIEKELDWGSEGVEVFVTFGHCHRMWKRIKQRRLDAYIGRSDSYFCLSMGAKSRGDDGRAELN